jgi:hypothetical protein
MSIELTKELKESLTALFFDALYENFYITPKDNSQIYALDSVDWDIVIDHLSDIDLIKQVTADLIKERDELKEFSCQLYSVITQLQKERDELKAHCGKLFGLVNDLDSYLDTNEFTSISHGSIFHQQMKHLITFAPQQSLNEIKAQAIDEAIDEIGFIECAGKIPAIDLFDLREYVSQLREQGDRE